MNGKACRAVAGSARGSRRATRGPGLRNFGYFLLLGCAPPALLPTSVPRPSLESSRQAGARFPPPRPAARAREGVVGLAVSSARSEALAVVLRFFDAVGRESLPDLEALMSEEATLTTGLGQSSQEPTKVWSTRFQRFDYAPPSGRRLIRSRHVGLFNADELRQLGGLRAFRISPGPDELLAVVEPAQEQVAGAPRRFGRRLEFLLGPESQGLVIRALFEDFRLP